MRSWLALALWFVVARASAQGALEDPGPVLEAPYQACEGCTAQRVWSDPYAASIVHLRGRRPSRFWPIALMAAGTLGVVAGVSGIVGHGEDSALTRVEGSLVLGLGAAAVGTGAYWYRRNAERRAQVDAQIARLQMARAVQVSPLAHAASPIPSARDDELLVAELASLRRERPPIGWPIALLSGGGLMVVYSSLLIFANLSDYVDGPLAPWVVGLVVGGALTVTGGVLLQQRLERRRPINARMRELRSSRLDLSLAPFVVRW
ncbi:MAG TPA: hypothetical protein VFX59_06700 [Polyangiales bacterium]|nr:hypothetical protein [Polyangiales bacterium]